MTNAYNMSPYQYGNSVYAYQETQKQNNVLKPVAGMAGIGFVAGSGIGYLRNLYPIKGGLVTDEFASSALDKYIEKGYAIEGKKFFKELKNVMKKLDSIKTPEKFKKLLNKNSEVKKKVYNSVSFEKLMETLDETNIKSIKNALKDRLKAERMHGVADMKEIIIKYWDESSKKFVLPKTAKDKKILKVLKSTGHSVQIKNILKYGGITAGIFGGLTLGYKLLTGKKQKEQSYNLPQSA